MNNNKKKIPRLFFTNDIRTKLLSLTESSDYSFGSLMGHIYRDQTVEKRTGLPISLINIVSGLEVLYKLEQDDSQEKINAYSRKEITEEVVNISKEFVTRFLKSVPVGIDLNNFVSNFKIRVLRKVLLSMSNEYDCYTNCRDHINCSIHPNAYVVVDLIEYVYNTVNDLDSYDTKKINRHLLKEMPDLKHNISVLKDIVSDQLFDDLSCVSIYEVINDDDDMDDDDMNEEELDDDDYYDNNDDILNLRHYFSYQLAGSLRVLDYIVSDKRSLSGFMDVVIKTIVGSPDIESFGIKKILNDLDQLLIDTMMNKNQDFNLEQEKEDEQRENKLIENLLSSTTNNNDSINTNQTDNIINDNHFNSDHEKQIFIDKMNDLLK